MMRTVFIAALLCTPAYAATTNMATGLSGAIGVAFDRTSDKVYFVDYNAGALKSISGATACSTASTPPCNATIVAGGFSHPEDVALDTANNMAYVTTRDDPGTTGALWRVDLGTGARSLVTFNLGAPQQIVLDVATNSAYTVGYDSGRLWKVDLTTGSKTTVIKGLGHPIGLAITANRAYAYVTEESTLRLTKIDMAVGVADSVALTALTAPFFLSWTDPGETTLYLVERSPSNRVLRVDLPTSTGSAVITGLASGASAMAVDWMGGMAFITTDSTIVRADLGALPLTAPIFMGVGFVPVDDIDSQGYATTSTPRITAKDAPFGGTLDIFANFNQFKNVYSATHYRVLLDGKALGVSWSSQRFNPATGRYETVGIAPVAALSGDTTNTVYEIPPEYPTVPERWYPTFLLMRWPSSTNGLHTLTIELLAKNASTGAFDAVAFSDPEKPKNVLKVRIDNDPPQVDLLQVYQVQASTGSLSPIATCSIVSSGDRIFRIGVKAYDPNGHLLNYTAWANWGHNRSRNVVPTEKYEPAHVAADRMWYGETNRIGPATAPCPGSAATPGWCATCNCAHIFYVGAWKRTINGYWLISYRQAHQAITINNVASPSACP